jgi:hypothetical protein
MTGDVVNLRRVRKAKARSERERAAAANRVKFGRTKAERTSAEAEQARAQRHHTGHLLVGDDVAAPRAPDRREEPSS